MSAVAPGDQDKWWSTPDPCFVCLSEIPADKAMVLWSGAQTIALHWECALRLGTALIGDAREAQISSGETVWQKQKGTALFMVRHHLERQERGLDTDV